MHVLFPERSLTSLFDSWSPRQTLLVIQKSPLRQHRTEHLNYQSLNPVHPDLDLFQVLINGRFDLFDKIIDYYQQISVINDQMKFVERMKQTKIVEVGLPDTF